MSDTTLLKKVTGSQGGTWQRLMFWKLAIAKLVCLCLLAAGASITATLNGVEWSDFTGTQKFLALVSLVTAVVSTVLAFLSETMAKLTAKAEEEKQIEDAKP